MNTALLTLFAGTLNVWAFLLIAEYQIGFLNWIEIPFVAAALLASLLWDAWIYAWHRLNQRTPFFWRFHQVHHSDVQMDLSTALRFHPGEILLSSLANIVVFTALGIALEYMILYKVVFNLNVLFHHSNVAIPEKWDRILRLFLVSPNMHRVHHSRRMRETNSNYSSVLSVWDRLFGTYRESETDRIVFGLEYDRTVEAQSLVQLMKRPFIRRNDPPREGDSTD